MRGVRRLKSELSAAWHSRPRETAILGSGKMLRVREPVCALPNIGGFRGSARVVPRGRLDEAAARGPMKIQFLGGAGTVTGSKYLVTTVRSQVLVDCGLFHGSATE